MKEESGDKKIDSFERYERERENLVLYTLIYFETVEIFSRRELQ